MKSYDIIRIEELLSAMYNMAQSPDWNESEAQELIMWGADMYEKFFKNEEQEM